MIKTRYENILRRCIEQACKDTGIHHVESLISIEDKTIANLKEFFDFGDEDEMPTITLE